jgi:hypothetical protein
MFLLLLLGGVSMGVKFNTGSLKDAEHATYNISNFNGVDYTDTPTNVDDSRAIEISNYLPEGNSLYKRNGWERQEYPFENGYKLANIFKFQDKYVFLGRSKQYPTTCSFFIADDLEYTNGSQILGSPALPRLFSIAEDYNGWAFEKDNTLFVFTGEAFVKIQYLTFTYTTVGVTQTFSGYLVNSVSNSAYIPTIAIGVVDEQSTASSTSSYEQFNMLSNKANVEINLNYSNGNFTETSTSGAYHWESYEVFDLTNYFTNFNNLQVLYYDDLAPATFTDSNQITYQKITLTNSKVALCRLNGKKLEVRIYGATGVNQDGTVNYVDYTAQQEAKGMKGIKTIKITLSFDNSEAISTINGMRYGAFFGSNGYRDTLFVTGNPDYKNLDVHTCTPKDTSQEDWVTYTYFGDMSYHKIGSSSSAILGYGVNNDSSMMIFKESQTNEPNVYIRTAQSKIETKTIEMPGDIPNIVYNDAYDLYQVFPSAINIKIDTREQIIQYDNKVLINGKYGIYYINVNDSTAASSYDGVEASYFIRNNLGNDISDSCFVEYNDKLYIARKDVYGRKRVYVCDKNRYSFHNSKMIYEWWVLDNIPAERMFVFDNELYFLKNGKLYKFTSGYSDLDRYEFSGINISAGNDSTSFVTDLFFDYDKNEMIIAPTNEFIVDCKTSPNPKEAYETFRDRTTVQLGNTIYWVLDDYLDTTANGFVMKNNIARNEIINTIVEYLEKNDYKFYKNGVEYETNDNWQYVYNDEQLIGITFSQEPVTTGDTISVNENATYMIPLPNTTKFQLSSLNNGQYGIDKSTYKEATWTYIDEGIYEELGPNAVFNHFRLALNGVEIDFALDDSFISVATLEFKKPVKSYWYSSFSPLGKLDYLKTATNLYFVPDAIKGGYTNVGYRTWKKDVGYFANAKGSVFDFDVNFEDFTFSQTEFGRTYSSKKKIKNFSFIQLKFYSYEAKNSTLVSCSFRYKYSKNNKGVK